VGPVLDTLYLLVIVTLFGKIEHLITPDTLHGIIATMDINQNQLKCTSQDTDGRGLTRLGKNLDLNLFHSDMKHKEENNGEPN